MVGIRRSNADPNRPSAGRGSASSRKHAGSGLGSAEVAIERATSVAPEQMSVAANERMRMFDAKRARSRSPSFARAVVGRLTADSVASLGIVALAAASFGWFFYGRGLDVPDEGLLLHVAERLAAGEVPYRDVYFIYTPGLQC